MSNESLLVIGDLINKYTSIFFAERIEDLEPHMRKRIEDYLLLRFRQIFALAGGAEYPCEDLGKVLKDEKEKNHERLEKIVEGIMVELKAYIDSEERERERRRKGGKPLIESYVT
ncbi:MAG: hypothetical protein WED04_11365 [Promethearchaeati archaeon SRVP18_Atabeyarchaeia-1]